MSVTICYRPTSKQAPHFSGGTSTSLEKLERVFGRRIGADKVHALRAMAIVGEDQFYDEVADVIEKHGEIEVWGEY